MIEGSVICCGYILVVVTRTSQTYVTNVSTEIPDVRTGRNASVEWSRKGAHQRERLSHITRHINERYNVRLNDSKLHIVTIKIWYEPP